MSGSLYRALGLCKLPCRVWGMNPNSLGIRTDLPGRFVRKTTPQIEKRIKVPCHHKSHDTSKHVALLKEESNGGVDVKRHVQNHEK